MGHDKSGRVVERMDAEIGKRVLRITGTIPAGAWLVQQGGAHRSDCMTMQQRAHRIPGRANGSAKHRLLPSPRLAPALLIPAHDPPQ
jgi:hypothetical protein